MKVGHCIQCGNRCTVISVDDKGRSYMGCASCPHKTAKDTRAFKNCPDRLFQDVSGWLVTNHRLATLLRVGVVVNSVAGWFLLLVGIYQWRYSLCVDAAIVFAVAWWTRRWLRLVLSEIRRLEGS